ncbi:mate-domain-containing protein [Tribonema minus]|uniref:Mate-domain-containing protein n=1 Tax=Tribonema minus TaxID=303371 RepID=A0A836CP32_9STRA|nr:mate-domain-containing protein [Tribonema minus]
MVTMISQAGMVVTDQVMVGHLIGTTQALAAAGVGNTIFNIVWYIIVGAASALDTMGSQSWGAGDQPSLHKWGCVCGVTLLVMNLGAALVLALGEPIALALHQTAETAAMVGVFCRLLIPGMPPLTLAIILHKMLQVQGRVAALMLTSTSCVQGRVAAPMVISVATFCVNLGANELFIRAFGFEGAPTATSVSRAAMLLFTLAYLACAPLVPAHPQRPAALLRKVPRFWQGRGAFLALALQGGAMMGLEASSFDVTTAFAARLGEVEVAAHAAIISIVSFTFYSFPFGISIASSIRVVAAHAAIICIVSFTFYSFPFGISIASSIRVGNLLGAQRPHLARVSAFIAVTAGVLFMFICGIIMLSAREVLGRLFTSDEDVVDAIAVIAPLAALFQVFDGTMGTTAGALRGMGRQKELLYFNIIGLWCAGVLSGYLLAFTAGLELRGLWTGVCLGVFTTAMLNLAVLLRVNWPLEARLAAIRTDTVSTLTIPASPSAAEAAVVA